MKRLIVFIVIVLFAFGATVVLAQGKKGSGGGAGPSKSGGGDSGGNDTKPSQSGGGNSGGSRGTSGSKSGPGPTPSGGNRSSGQQTGSSRYQDPSKDYIRQAPSSSGYLQRKNRGQDGPAFVPRSNTVPLDTNNNQGRSRDNRLGNISTIPVPSNNSSSRGGSSLAYKIDRQEPYRVGNLRRGYYHYDNNWCDRFFGFGWYVFDPFAYDCVFSPYYYYCTVPGYVRYLRISFGSPRVVVIFGDPIRWGYCGRRIEIYSGYHYRDDWRYRNYDSYSSLDRAISDLVDAFEFADADLLSKFLPRGSRVEIFIDGNYAYTMSSDDYYDMTADLIYSVYTTRFNVESVRRTRDGDYFVIARHEYQDPWNVKRANYLTFTLSYERGGYVITQAGSSQSRIRL